MGTDISYPSNNNEDFSHRTNGGGNSNGSFYSGNLSGSQYDGAIRFKNLLIPKKSNIGNSTLYFLASSSGWNNYKANIKGINDGNTPSFTETNPFTRSQTGNSTSITQTMESGYLVYFTEIGRAHV